MKLTVEHDIPIPARGNKSKTKWREFYTLFGNLKEGCSIFVELEGSGETTPELLCIRLTASPLKHYTGGYTVRSYENGVRVWKIKPISGQIHFIKRWNEKVRRDKKSKK